MPSGEQARRMRQFAGACRFVYNRTLALQKETHEAGGKYLGKFALGKQLTEWRNSADTPWLSDPPRHALMIVQQARERVLSR